ncbi:MAG: hypothetical protein IJC19_07480 [Clostridia bacterium]|nr:hypothetical protein [Clostridia bacterium]
MNPKSPLIKSTNSPYWMISAESEKSRMLFVNGALIFVCALLLLMSAMLTVETFSSEDDKPIKNQEKMNFIALDNNTEYCFREMIVIDAYTYYENPQTHQIGAQYYLVCFYDRNLELCYASLRVDADSAIRTQCNNYLMNENAYPGDLTLSGYFSCSDLKDQESILQENYKELMESYRKEWQGEDTGKHFVFDAKTEAELQQIHQKNALTGYLSAAALLLVGAAGLTVLIWWRKKLTKRPQNNTASQGSTPVLNGEPAEGNEK